MLATLYDMQLQFKPTKYNGNLAGRTLSSPIYKQANAIDQENQLKTNLLGSSKKLLYLICRDKSVSQKAQSSIY